MNKTRTIIGSFIIVFLGIPSLFAIIWAVGLTKAAVSPELLSDLPQEIIAEVPDLVNDILTSVQDKDDIFKDNTEKWIKVIPELETSPKELLEKIGLLKWLENELSESLQSIGDILRGKRKSFDVVLNLRPLKLSLSHKAVDQYFFDILKKLPPCDEMNTEIWKSLAIDNESYEDLPACQPDLKIAKEVLQQARNEIIYDIPDEIDIFQGDWFFRGDIDFAKTIISLTYLLFLIPAVFIILGSLIASTSKSSFFTWSGIATLIGGIFPLAISLLLKNIIIKFIHLAPCSHFDVFSTELQEIIFEKMGGIMHIVVNQLFSPVGKVAGTVCVIGVVLFALSFAVSDDKEPKDTHQDQKQVQKDETKEEETENK